MTERLEEIKTRFNAMKELESFKKLAPTDLFFDDLNWLLQQAERVEELEEALLQTKYDRRLYIASVEKRERYKQALEEIATRKMSQYLTVRDMNNDFIKIANKALEELK